MSRTAPLRLGDCQGTDLSHHTPKRVAAVMNELNTRPRKLLNCDTPAARFNAARTPRPIAAITCADHDMLRRP